jgi:hypothetical protein
MTSRSFSKFGVPSPVIWHSVRKKLSEQSNAYWIPPHGCVPSVEVQKLCILGNVFYITRLYCRFAYLVQLWYGRLIEKSVIAMVVSGVSLASRDVNKASGPRVIEERVQEAKGAFMTCETKIV